MDFAGEFETHVTVALATAQPVGLLQHWASKHGFKCLHILLARGQHVSQPMVTRRGRGTLAAQLAQAKQVCHQLADAGFTVTRVKIEAATSNDDVPQTDADAASQPRERYFEHHVKLLIEPRLDHSKLVSLAERHCAHLSRNSLRAHADHREERFVTQRCWAVGCKTAERRLGTLVEELTTADYEIIDIEREFVIYDSNLEVDAGWLQEERINV